MLWDGDFLFPVPSATADVSTEREQTRRAPGERHGVHSHSRWIRDGTPERLRSPGDTGHAHGVEIELYVLQLIQLM